ncbi:hypothetical protein BDZ97DRAFT_1920937 [Flammula alnicola]|nr:hypothetical protein BDZ97DRAFT_1920937 [Flammula alnicola]
MTGDSEDLRSGYDICSLRHGSGNLVRFLLTKGLRIARKQPSNLADANSLNAIHGDKLIAQTRVAGETLQPAIPSIKVAVRRYHRRGRPRHPERRQVQLVKYHSAVFISANRALLRHLLGRLRGLCPRQSIRAPNQIVLAPLSLQPHVPEEDDLYLQVAPRHLLTLPTYLRSRPYRKYLPSLFYLLTNLKACSQQITETIQVDELRPVTVTRGQARCDSIFPAYVHIPAGTRPGTEIVLQDIGHERKDGMHRDIAFLWPRSWSAVDSHGGTGRLFGQSSFNSFILGRFINVLKVFENEDGSTLDLAEVLRAAPTNRGAKDMSRCNTFVVAKAPSRTKLVDIVTGASVLEAEYCEKCLMGIAPMLVSQVAKLRDI